MPSYGGVAVEAAASHYALPTRGLASVIPGYGKSSLLCYGFNRQWCVALNWHRAGMVDYWCLHHADVEVRTHGWLDVMVEEMRRVGAAVLSVVQAIKAPGGDTSTALESGDLWSPRRLRLPELALLPRTFCAADCAAVVPGYDGPLLVNTGLMLVDLHRPEWRAVRNADGSLAFRFHIEDRVTEQPDGDLKPGVRPEDWEFSRLCHAHGLPVYATYAVDCLHHGEATWPNQPPPPLVERADGEVEHEHATA